MSERRQTGQRPTLRDVAQQAGVSISTASHVYSGKRAVAPETAQRVRTAADDLGYLGPDPLASSLRQGRAGVVAAHFDDALRYAFADPFAVSVLDGLSQVLDDLGVGLLLASGQGDADRSSILDRQALDAVVFPLCGSAQDALIARLVARGIPVVGTGMPTTGGTSRLTVDEAGSLALITEHVLSLGHTRIGHIAMPLNQPGVLRPITPDLLATAAYLDSRERVAGFRSVAGADAPIVEAAALTIDAGAAAAALLLDGAPDLTAIVAQSDLLAAGVLREAAERGLRVPYDLSVTGFDGIDLPWVDGSLTTIVQDGAAKGRRLGEMVVARLAGTAGPDVHEEFPTHLRIGTTTAAPPDAR